MHAYAALIMPLFPRCARTRFRRAAPPPPTGDVPDGPAAGQHHLEGQSQRQPNLIHSAYRFPELGFDTAICVCKRYMHAGP